MVRIGHVLVLVCITLILHAMQVLYTMQHGETTRSLATTPPPVVAAAETAAPAQQSVPAESTASSSRAVGGRPQLLIATATQPAPCTTAHGDHVIQLSLKNKMQYATLHGFGVWPSTELLSPWDLGGQWNKVALLSVLMDVGDHRAYDGEWIMWMDDDAIFVDMRFAFPLAKYDREGIDLVMWGDEKMTYVDGDSEGINTGTMLLRVSDWTRSLLAAWTEVASSAIRESLRNADQGGLVHLLHSQPERWRAKTRLERDFTMNGHWPTYAGQLVRGSERLKTAVWGSDTPPFILHFSGCQMCRGHSFNGTWTESGVEACRRAFMEAFTYADDVVLERVGMRHLRLGQMTVRPMPGTPLQLRHQRLSRCMPSFLVVGTQKGGTSSLHYMLKAGWHSSLRVNEGEKEIHYFSFDDNYAKGATVYQQRWDGPKAKLGSCPKAAMAAPQPDGGASILRGEVSATYLDYPRAAERAAALVPAAKIVVLLREPVARVTSSFNMRWQIEVCGKLTWTRPDCYNGVRSREMIRENAVGPFQRNAAMKVWSKCNDGRNALRIDCLRADFVSKLRNRTRTEMQVLDRCVREQAMSSQASEGLGNCHGLRTLSQKKLYKLMEDVAYLYRSIYVEHLQNWLKFYPPSQLLVLPSEALFADKSRPPAMAAFAAFLGVPADGPAVNSKVLSSASPAATDGSPHENGRTYVVSSAPEDVATPLRAWLCPKNRQLRKLLERHQLTPSAEALASGDAEAAQANGGRGGHVLPWLEAALAECDKHRQSS